MWLKVDGFVDKVRSWWEAYTFRGSPRFRIASKLQVLKLDLKKWNEEEFGNVESRMCKLWKDLNDLDLIADCRPLTDEEILEKDWLRTELEKVTLMEEICWRQKSKALWIREGDRNSKFFHRIANSHRRFNTINNLVVEGELTSNPSSIAACISLFYKQLYTENEGQRPLLDEVEFSRISGEDAAQLDRPFEEKEVYGVIKDCNGDKSPGLDGFSMAFFQPCWDFLKQEIMELFGNFHSQAVFEKSINAIFLSLIPKKVNVVSMRDFRPISLVGGIYKILSKVLANRLKRVILGIISETQNAFVPDRQILDSVLIANECLDSRLKVGVIAVLCKLNVEKAFDNVGWDFLIATTMWVL